MSIEALNNDYACPFYFSFHPDLDRTTGAFQSRVSYQIYGQNKLNKNLTIFTNIPSLPSHTTFKFHWALKS